MWHYNKLFYYILKIFQQLFGCPNFQCPSFISFTATQSMLWPLFWQSLVIDLQKNFFFFWLRKKFFFFWFAYNTTIFVLSLGGHFFWTIYAIFVWLFKTDVVKILSLWTHAICKLQFQIRPLVVDQPDLVISSTAFGHNSVLGSYSYEFVG